MNLANNIFEFAEVSGKETHLNPCFFVSVILGAEGAADILKQPRQEGVLYLVCNNCYPFVEQSTK